MQPRRKELDELVQWLVDRGVGRKQARKFIIKYVTSHTYQLRSLFRFMLHLYLCSLLSYGQVPLCLLRRLGADNADRQLVVMIVSS
jgi:hypothetical protein